MLTIDLYVIFKTNFEVKNIQDLLLNNYEKTGSESTTCDKEGDIKAGRSAYNEQSVSVDNVLVMDLGQNHVSSYSYHVLDTAYS